MVVEREGLFPVVDVLVVCMTAEVEVDDTVVNSEKSVVEENSSEPEVVSGLLVVEPDSPVVEPGSSVVEPRVGVN